MQQQSAHTITRLTALWALSESGLGGMMHALKIPFTGFFLGGFAIVIITLLAQVSHKPFRTIMQATLLVVLVKAAASPHSPPMAYIAVGFQGLCGAIVYSSIPWKRIAGIVFGSLALFESAIQKFLVATLIFGKNIWEALDGFVSSVLKDLSQFHSFSFSFWLIALYTTVYVVWGGLLGWWASGLMDKLGKRAQNTLQQLKAIQTETTEILLQKPKRKNIKLLKTLFVLAFIVVVFSFQGQEYKAFWAIARTLAALWVLFWIITPGIQWALQKLLQKKQSSSSFKQVMETLPELRGYIQPALSLAKQQSSGFIRYKAFVENLIIMALYA